MAQEAQEEAQEAQLCRTLRRTLRRNRNGGAGPLEQNKPKQDAPAEPVAPKRKPKPPPLATAPAEAPAAAPVEVPAPVEAAEAPQLTREQQRALRMLERQSAYDRLTKAQVYWYESMMSIEPQRAADAPVVPQDVPQLQLAALLLKR